VTMMLFASAIGAEKGVVTFIGIVAVHVHG
jgi:hypothetical protein